MVSRVQPCSSQLYINVQQLSTISLHQSVRLALIHTQRWLPIVGGNALACTWVEQDHLAKGIDREIHGLYVLVAHCTPHDAAEKRFGPVLVIRIEPVKHRHLEATSYVISRAVFAESCEC